MSELTERVVALFKSVHEDDSQRTHIIPFDQNGHLVSSWPSRHYIKADIEHVRRIVELIPEISLRSHLGLYHGCTFCGEKPNVALVGNAVKIMDPCSAPDGITTVIDLHVPSGKIIVSDSLGPVYEAVYMDDLDYNTAIGQAKFIERMAAIGCAYGPVGNSCPSVYRISDGKYVIANPEYDSKDEPTGNLATAEQVASICTDLWAYSIADLDDYLAKGGDADRGQIVEVPPGTYRFTHHTGERSFDHDNWRNETIYAHMEVVPDE